MVSTLATTPFLCDNHEKLLLQQLKNPAPPIIIGPQVYRKFEAVRSAVQVNDVMRNTTGTYWVTNTSIGTSGGWRFDCVHHQGEFEPVKAVSGRRTPRCGKHQFRAIKHD